MKLFRLSISLTTTSLKFSIQEWEGEKKQKSFILSSFKKTWGNGEITEEIEKKIISFDKILVPTTKMFETHKFLGYSLWALPEQIEEGKIILKAKLEETFNTIQKEFEGSKMQISKLDQL